MLYTYISCMYYCSQVVGCEYSFEWPTLLGCPHKELECAAAGGRYDL